MSKHTRRIVAMVVLALTIIPQVAFAAPTQSIPKDIAITGPIGEVQIIIGTPLGEKQTEYPSHANSAASFPAKILTVSTTPTKSGTTLYPNLYVQVAGNAIVTANTELQQFVNGKWQPVKAIFDAKSVNMTYSYNVGYPGEKNNTYRFTFIIVTNGGGTDSYYMEGNPFVLN